MKVCVTGGHGFIGSHLVRRLVALHHDIAILTRESSDLGRLQDVLPGLQRINGDVRRKDDMVRFIHDAQPDVVFHLATSNMQSGVRASDEEVIDTNLIGTSHLLAAVQAESGASFIQTGSFLEYGKKQQPMNETDLCEPQELYGITKLAATLLAQAAKTPTLTFRVFTPYGPDMQKGRLVEQIITRALRGEDILLTEPDITRDLIHVSDLVDLLVLGMEKAPAYPGNVFNAGSGKAVTLKMLAETVIAITGSKSPIRWHARPTVLYDTAFCQASMEKTFSRFPWQTAHDLESGLRATIDWYRSHPLSP